MPKDFRIDKTNRLVISTYSGTMVLEDVTEQWAAIKVHPDHDPNFSYLTDLTGVTDFSLSVDQVRHLANMDDPFTARSQRIIVAPGAAIYGMARVYERSGNAHPNITVVRSLEDGYALARPSRDDRSQAAIAIHEKTKAVFEW